MERLSNFQNTAPIYGMKTIKSAIHETNPLIKDRCVLVFVPTFAHLSRSYL